MMDISLLPPLNMNFMSRIFKYYVQYFDYYFYALLYVQIMCFHFYIRVEQLHGKLEVTGYIH
jgi:hypothetical protein